MKTKTAAALGLLLLAAGAAHAQISVEDLADAARRSPSLQMLVDVFGQIARNPFSAGSSPLGAGFAVLNASLLALGILWFTYTVGAGTLQTAHDGQFLGKRYSSVWLPIRFTVGVGALVPIFGGYSLAQAIMIWAAVSGAGLANITNNTMVKEILDGKAMVATPKASAPIAAAEGLFRAHVCVQAVNAGLNELADGRPFPGDVFRANQVHPTGWTFGRGELGRECGAVEIAQRHAELKAATSRTKDPGKRIDAAHRTGVDLLYKATAGLAAAYIDQLIEQEQWGDKVPAPQIPREALLKAAEDYKTRIAQAISGSGEAVTGYDSQFFTKAQREGWTALGQWFTTFALANERIANAAAIKIEIKAPSPDAGAAAPFWWNLARRNLDDPSAPPAPGESLTRSAFQEAADKTSPGQWIAEKLRGLLNFGGDGNALIQAKATGDSMIVAAEVITAGYGIAAATGLVDGKGMGSTIVLAAAGFLVAAGFALAIYLPLYPFIVWLMGILGWLVTVAEAVVAAPIWAFVHLDAEGDGLGQRTAHGYTFLLAVLLRPVLMTLSFFLAVLVLTTIGRYLASGFGMAMADAQQGSTTGAVSIIGYTIVYAGLMIATVHGSFNLINVLPDKVLGWVGSHLSGAGSAVAAEAPKAPGIK